MNTDSIPTATISNLFRFHGLLLPVVLHQGEEYIPVKPVVDLLGIDWRNIKKSLSGNYKQAFFGFCTLKVPLPHGLGGDTTPQIPCIYLARQKTTRNNPFSRKYLNIKLRLLKAMLNISTSISHQRERRITTPFTTPRKGGAIYTPPFNQRQCARLDPGRKNP